MLVSLDLPYFNGLPEFVVDDPQFRHLGDDPALRRVEPGDAFAGGGILYVAQPVPDRAADIQLVIQDAGAALGIAIDGALPPTYAAWPGDIRLVQRMGDGPWRLAVGKIPENAAHGLSFDRFDLAVTGRGGTIGAESADHPGESGESFMLR